MKKLFFGLLIVAAGAGVYFYFNKRTCDKPAQNISGKELIIGQWNLDSVSRNKDAASKNFIDIHPDSATFIAYEFTNDGKALGSLTIQQTSRYKIDSNHIIIFENPADSTQSVLQIVRLTGDSLQLQDADSSLMFLSKKK